MDSAVGSKRGRSGGDEERKEGAKRCCNATSGSGCMTSISHSESKTPPKPPSKQGDTNGAWSCFGIKHYKVESYTPVSIYKRQLPSTCIAFSSTEGRALFRRSMRQGYATGYFRLAEQFTTQSEPAYCGLSTLAMVLNTLAVDPGRTWKSPWRWYHDDMLECCRPLEHVKKHGVTFAEFICIAICNSLSVVPRYPCEHKQCGPVPALVLDEELSGLCGIPTDHDNGRKRYCLETFRADIRSACSSEVAPILVMSYSRAALKQTGDGHYTSVGAYEENSDRILIMDVARFKYPPHWVKVEDAYRAMTFHDKSTGQTRGWMMVSRRDGARPRVFHFHSEFVATCISKGWEFYAHIKDYWKGREVERVPVRSLSTCDTNVHLSTPKHGGEDGKAVRDGVTNSNTSNTATALSPRISLGKETAQVMQLVDHILRVCIGRPGYAHVWRSTALERMTVDKSSSKLSPLLEDEQALVDEMLSGLRAVPIYTVLRRYVNEKDMASERKHLFARLSERNQLESMVMLLLAVPPAVWLDMGKLGQVMTRLTTAKGTLLNEEKQALQLQLRLLTTMHEQCSCDGTS